MPDTAWELTKGHFLEVGHLLDIAPRGISERVIIAMSGGVDSSVAAKLLLDAGHDVLGLTMKLTTDCATRARYDTCGAPKDLGDAGRVACHLGFPHRFLDFEAAFEREVVIPFCQGYLNGETPNPCVTCNRYLKFEALQRCRRELGFEYVATGHYARRIWSEELGRYLLLRGVDKDKDQSYFLYHLDQKTLAHMLFPLGGYVKTDVRRLASSFGLEVADKSESQDICFIPDSDYVSFIEGHMGVAMEPGPIVNTQGEVLGTHRGLARYTIGQRKGLQVSYTEPLFVLRKEVERNTLVVGCASEQGVHELWARDVNLICYESVPDFIPVQAKVNYRQRPIPARARIEDTEGEAMLHVVFDEVIRSCAPGQSVVLYEGDIVVGGGTIARFS